MKKTSAIFLRLLLACLLAYSSACRSKSTTGNHNKQGEQLDMLTETGEGAGTEEKAAAKTETRIKGAFKGWSGETLFLLSNGQLWKQCAYAYHYSYAYNPEVLIEEENGAYYLHEKNKQEKVKVCRISPFVSTGVNGNFNGWKGGTVVKLLNGSEWRQLEPYVSVNIEIMPAAVLYNDGGTKLWIDGTDKPVLVVRN